MLLVDVCKYPYRAYNRSGCVGANEPLLQQCTTGIPEILGKEMIKDVLPARLKVFKNAEPKQGKVVLDRIIGVKLTQTGA